MCCVALPLLLAPLAHPQEAAPMPAENPLATAFQERFDELHGSVGVPGATAALRGAELRVDLAAGVLEEGGADPMTPAARMHSGSVGKTFVAATALELVEAGRLDLDAKVLHYLGERPWFVRLPNAADMSVRMLMNHTSGLVRYEFDAAFTADMRADPWRRWKVEEQLAYLFDEDAPFPAGERFEYSDTNYLVLGLILESLTGEPLFDTLEERWVRGLGLHDTLRSGGRRVEGMTQGHVSPDDPLVERPLMIVDGELPFDAAFEGAGGGWVSTSADLASWARALWREGGDVLPAALYAQVIDGVDAPMLGPGTRYGLGVILREDEHGLSLAHSGYFPGYLTEMRYWPEHDLAIAVQLNSSRVEALRFPPSRWIDELAVLALD